MARKMFELVKNKVNEYTNKYQIDLSYLIRSEFWVYLRFGISLFIGIGISVAFARLASKEIYGQYNYLIAILAIVSILSIPGLRNAVLLSTAKGNEGNYKLAVKTSFLWGLLGVPVLLAVGAYYYYYNTQIVGICLMISSIFFPLIYAPNIWDSFLAGKKRFDLTARYGSIQLTINAAAVIGILLLDAGNLVLIFYTYLVVSFAVTSFLYWKSLKYIKNNKKDKECQKYGYFLTTTNVAGTLAKHIDKILIGTLLGASELAIYAIALVVPTSIMNLLKVAFSPIAPKISQQGTRIVEALTKLRGLVLPLAIMVLGSSILYWFFIDDIMLLLFGTQYMEAGVYSKVLLLMILAVIPNSFLGTFAIAKKKTRAIVLGLHVHPFLKILIMFSFIYMWGLWGAVWGLNLSMVIQALLIQTGIGSEEWSSA